MNEVVYESKACSAPGRNGVLIHIPASDKDGLSLEDRYAKWAKVSTELRGDIVPYVNRFGTNLRIGVRDFYTSDPTSTYLKYGGRISNNNQGCDLYLFDANYYPVTLISAAQLMRKLPEFGDLHKVPECLQAAFGMLHSERDFLVTEVVDFGVARVCYLKRDNSSTEQKFITIPDNCSLESALALTEKYPIFSVQITNGEVTVIGKVTDRLSWKLDKGVKYRVVLDHTGKATHCVKAIT